MCVLYCTIAKEVIYIYTYKHHTKYNYVSLATYADPVYIIFDVTS